MALPRLCFVLLTCFLPLLHSGCAGSRAIPARDARLLGEAKFVESPSPERERPYAGNLFHAGDAAEFTVRVRKAGFYFLDLTYACEADKRIPVSINGNAQGSRFFPRTTGFETRPYGRVILPAGESVVRIGVDWGYADIAEIRLRRAPQPERFQLASAPCNPAASAEARELFTKLIAGFGRSTWAGQHESNPGAPSRVEHVARLTGGEQPAILGMDLLYYSGAWKRDAGDGVIEKALDWSRSGGVVTLSWHWFSPCGTGVPVWSSFLTEKTTFDISRLTDRDSAEYKLIVADLDRIADRLKVLRDARVPVLWRPLHEAEGGWFWWGARGPAATRFLYRLMFDRFTRMHGLDNLLWVWTTTDDPQARDWYPGDDYVDIVATDVYSPLGEHGDLFTLFDSLRGVYGGRKPIALGECGALPLLSPDAPWLWFLAWDDFIARPDFNPSAHVTRTYADPRVVTLKQVKPSRSGPRLID